MSDEKNMDQAIHEPIEPVFKRTIRRVLDQREEILRAFVAKYGFQPDEARQVERDTETGRVWYVERKPPVESVPAPVGLDRLVNLLDSLTDARHSEDCKAYGKEPDADADDDDDDEIDDNPLNFLEHCDCGLKDAFEAWKIAKSLASLPPRPATGAREPEICDWQLEDEDADLWKTGCGHEFVTTGGKPTEDEWKFCHACGKPIREMVYCHPCSEAGGADQAIYHAAPACPVEAPATGADQGGAT